MDAQRQQRDRGTDESFAAPLSACVGGNRQPMVNWRATNWAASDAIPAST
jgi:hypothetical protein